MTTRIDELMGEIEAAILGIRLADLRDGANDWAHVRVHPDGTVTSGREVSEKADEAEYYGRTPHALTVWSASGYREAADPSWGVFEWAWAEDGPYVGDERSGASWPVDQLDDDRLAGYLARGWRRFRLDRDSVVDPLSLDDAEREEIRARLESWATTNLAAEATAGDA